MSTLIIQHEGKLNWAKQGSGTFGAAAFHCRLFDNNFTPAATSVLADFTQAAFNGYTAGGAALANPVYAALDASNNRQVTWDAVTWTKAAGGATDTVYGAYFVLDAANTLCMWSILFDSPISMVATGNVITFTPSLYWGTLLAPF